MQSVTSLLNAAQGLNVREAMNRFRAQRTQTVQRLMSKISERSPAGEGTDQYSLRPADPAGKLGATIDVQA